MAAERTQVGIVGAGPAGLLLARLLHLNGIDCMILEARSRAYVENRIRAGVLEWNAVRVLEDAGVAGRLHDIGLPHEGVVLRYDQRDHRIDFRGLTGKHVTVYSQHEVVRDLIAANLAAGVPIVFEASDVHPLGFDDDAPEIAYVAGGEHRVLRCDYIAGCDGFHGVCRGAIPAGVLTVFDRIYPFAWLGILADAPPSSHELVYANHANGFALLSMRSTSVSRLYLQCAPDEDLEAWPDARIWDELRVRLATREGFALTGGPVLQKGVTPMRSFVVEPMQHGRLFLAGDAAHIVPPTGAKGMNMAIADVTVLARALATRIKDGDGERLARYSADCTDRVWKVQRFSWWMTSMLHRFAGQTPFDRRMQIAELDYVATYPAASALLAENYVGLPIG
ncbi:MAG TPA: 4-hydroxybenzoate 3-monooxygenase [Acidisphaera sp.]|nr:4-hydroxybenzoate 3-monooxygenase [Acidisphaera sp.]